MVGEGTLDGLLDPPGCVGGELATLFGVEAFHGLHQADIALGNEIIHGHAVIGVVLGDFHDQTQVGLDHVRTGLLVSVFNAFRQFNLLLGGEKRSFRDLPEVELQTAFGLV